jgi:uncharacterized caspase-like protein
MGSERAGVGLFYYSGHGLQVRGENYLVPIGADVQREHEVDSDDPPGLLPGQA